MSNGGETTIEGIGNVRLRSGFYLDKNDRLIDGVTVRFILTEFDEEHEINVPSKQPVTIRKALEKFRENRWLISPPSEE